MIAFKRLYLFLLIAVALVVIESTSSVLGLLTTRSFSIVKSSSLVQTSSAFSTLSTTKTTFTAETSTTVRRSSTARMTPASKSSFISKIPSTSKVSSTTKSSVPQSASTSSKSSITLLAASSAGSTNGLLFTSVAATMRTSQASCYHLPTPTQLLTAVTPVLNPNNTFPPEFASYFRRFFLAEDDSSNKTALKYVTVAGKDSDNYTLDFSMWNVLGISGTAGTSILIHHGGVRLSTAKCELTVDFEIANFTDQLRRAALVHKTSSRSHTFSRRHIQKEFLVQLRFQTQCGGTPNINLNPWVNLGPSSCLALDQDHTYGYYRWDCQFPGKDSEEMKCEAAVTNFLDLVAGGLMGSTTNWATVGDLVLRGLAKLVNRNVLLALALSAGLTFTSPATLAILAAVETTFVVGTQSLAVIETALAVYNHYSDHGIAEDICMILHKNEFPVPLIVNAGSTVKTLAQLSAPPADISQSIKIVDPNEKTCHVCHNSAVNCTSAAGCLGLETACGEGCHCIRSMEGVQFCAWMFYPPYRTNWQTCYSSDQCAINNLCWATAFGNNPGQVGPTAPTCMFSAPHTCGFPDIAA